MKVQPRRASGLLIKGADLEVILQPQQAAEGLVKTVFSRVSKVPMFSGLCLDQENAELAVTSAREGNVNVTVSNRAKIAAR